MKKRVLSSVIAGLLLSASIMTASAHSVVVQPPGQDDPVFVDAISTNWAQAHCNAQAPEKATANSGGTVIFSPAEALPCLGDPGEDNPGR